MVEPNIFTFASSELSQDAFICWLLSWAKPEYRATHSELHQCSIHFIQSLLEKHTEKSIPSQIHSIKIQKQEKNIDVLCIINNKYHILIEDKTKTQDHSNQLQRYLNHLQSKIPSENIFPIYFKTHDQACYQKIIDVYGYKVFSRKDFLTILNNGITLGVKNDIFNSFRLHLQNIEDDVQNYLNKPLGSWNKQAWRGFFIELQQRLETGLWKEINPPSGKQIMGFWWGGQARKPYLQLEEKKLCFKISIPENTESKAFVTYWHNTIKSMSHTLDKDLALIKPARLSKKGKHITIMILQNDDYRNTQSNGLIDMDSTVTNLKKLDHFLKIVQQSSFNI